LLLFSDKNHNPFLLSAPGDFLSADALERRQKAGIPLEENDLPVSPFYLKALKDKGLKIHGASKWLNAAVVIAESKDLIDFPFVKAVEYLGPHLKFRNPPNRPEKQRSVFENPPRPGGSENPMGYAGFQNSLLGIPPLYAAGLRGKGIKIAVMDGGFSNADTLHLFDSLGLHGRLVPGWDFVERDLGLFESASHGTSVLSVMAGNIPGYFVGTAPDATYYLIKTEDTGGDFPIEEFNWVLGAEWADSAGVHLINASLGYTSFNDTSLSHSYQDLDGKTSLASLGGKIAASKGIIICNSAGNEGNDPWHFIGVPADVAGIIAVGAVSSDGSKAEFSAFGPTFDGRIKPDLVAPGENVVVAGNEGIDLGFSSGTSISSPMLTGALASLWSVFPEKNAQEILEAVFRSSDQFPKPDNERGWGMPNMTEAWLQLGEYQMGQTTFFFDRNQHRWQILYPDYLFNKIDSVEITDVYGRTFEAISWDISINPISTVHVQAPKHIQPGMYSIKIKNEKQQETFVVAAIIH
jgi:hypothetical protein